MSSNLGSLLLERTHFDAATQQLTHALELQRKLKASRDIPVTLVNLGETACNFGDYTLAHDSLSEAISHFKESDNPGMEGVALNSYTRLSYAQGNFPTAASMLLESTRLLVSTDNQMGIPDNAELLAAVCTQVGRHEDAARFMSAASSIRIERDATMSPLRLREHQETDDAARKALDKDIYALHWDMDLDSLTRRISIVAREITGTRHASPVLAGDEESAVETVPVVHNLTGREIEILKLLSEGQSTREVSEALFISPRTTATHITNILGKLNVTSRTAAVAYAMRSGLV